MKKINLEKRKNIVINYIRRNPKATYKDIRNDLKIHPERVFKNGMLEAYNYAKILPPRTFKFKDKEKKKKLIKDYIRKNNYASSNQIKKDLKINISSVFLNIKEAYNYAGVLYPRETSYNKSPEEKREIIIKIIKENPNITLTELINKSGIKNPYRLFKDISDIYNKANIKFISSFEKIKYKKRDKIIKYIKKNNLATQREINKKCKTHVQEIFNNGIIEAYEKAGIKYPFERINLHGTALKDIKIRARIFEEEISRILSGYGKINRLVKTKRGFADIILERKDKKIIIEIKDYVIKEISISQINQLNKYMEDIESDIGFLVCHKKPKKDTFLIGKNRIFVLVKEELKKIPELIEGK